MAINRHMCLGLSFPTGCADARSLARNSEGGLQLSAPQRHHRGAGLAGIEGVLAHTEDRAGVHVHFRLSLLEDSMVWLLQPPGWTHLAPR